MGATLQYDLEARNLTQRLQVDSVEAYELVQGNVSRRIAAGFEPSGPFCRDAGDFCPSNYILGSRYQGSSQWLGQGTSTCAR